LITKSPIDLNKEEIENFFRKKEDEEIKSTKTNKEKETKISLTKFIDIFKCSSLSKIFNLLNFFFFSNRIKKNKQGKQI